MAFLSAIADIILGRLVEGFADKLIGYRSETGSSGPGNLVDLLIGQFKEKRWQELFENFEQLKQLTLILGSVIEDVMGHQVTNEALLLWLGELTEGMYQGECILDTMEIPSTTTSTRFDQGSYDELLRVVEKLHDLKSNTTLVLKILKRCKPLGGCDTNYLNMKDERMFGRIVEKARVINFLQNEDPGDFQTAKILIITGAEGHGKTALAKYFYEKVWVRNHFSLSVWLDGRCMHDAAQFLGKLLEKLLSSSDGTSEDVDQFDLLRETVKTRLAIIKTRLRNRMFLLVIDNACEVDTGIWSILKDCLESGNRGSRVIITGRSIGVIDPGTVESLTLTPMRSSEYRCFFLKLVFGQNNSQNLHEYQKLAKIAKEIAYMLNGSPSAAKDMAARLQQNISIQNWENIMQELRPAEGRESRGSSSTNTTGSWLKTELLLTKRYEEIAQAATDANMRAATMERRLEILQSQMEIMIEMSQDIRPTKKARLESLDCELQPLPAGNNQLRRRESSIHPGAGGGVDKAELMETGPPMQILKRPNRGEQQSTIINRPSGVVIREPIQVGLGRQALRGTDGPAIDPKDKGKGPASPGTQKETQSC